MSDSFNVCSADEFVILLYPTSVELTEENELGFVFAKSIIPVLVYLNHKNLIKLKVENIQEYLALDFCKKIVSDNTVPEQYRSQLKLYLKLIQLKPSAHAQAIYNVYLKILKSLTFDSKQSVFNTDTTSLISNKKTPVITNDDFLDYTYDQKFINVERFFSMALEDSIKYRSNSVKYSLNILRFFLRSSLQHTARIAHTKFIGETAENKVYESNSNISWKLVDYGIRFQNNECEILGQSSRCVCCGSDCNDQLGFNDLCALCYESAHPIESKGYMIWLPELTQAELNWLTKWASSVSIYKDSQVFNYITDSFKDFFLFISHRKTVALDLFGSNYASEYIFKSGWTDQRLLQGLRYFSFVGDDINDIESWDFPIRFYSMFDKWKIRTFVPTSAHVASFLNDTNVASD